MDKNKIVQKYIDVRTEIVKNLASGRISPHAASEAIVWSGVMERQEKMNVHNPENDCGGGWCGTGYDSEGESAGAL